MTKDSPSGLPGPPTNCAQHMAEVTPFLPWRGSGWRQGCGGCTVRSNYYLIWELLLLLFLVWAEWGWTEGR